MRGPASSEPPEDIEDRDPSLARERTELAWTRTAISFAALGVAILHTNAVAGALVRATAVAVWMLGQLSARNLTSAKSQRRPNNLGGSMLDTSVQACGEFLTQA